MYCPKCGTENSNDVSFCSNCGESLKDAPASDANKKSAEIQSIRQDTASDELENGFDKIIIKILKVLNLTSGTGLIGLGGFWFIYGVFQYMAVSADNIMQQEVQETFFLQAELGIVIVGIGILIRVLKNVGFSRKSD